MKESIIFLMLLAGVSTSFAQETGKEKEKPQRITLVKAGQTAPNNSQKEELTPEQELKNCEAQLQAIRKKEEYLKSNPEEMKIAEENNWFKDAEKNKALLVARIKELKLELKK